MPRRNKPSYICLLFVLLSLISCSNKENDLPDLSSMGEIVTVTREEGSGTRSEYSTLLGSSLKDTGKTAFSSREVVDLVAADKDAIGYVAYSAIPGEMLEDIKVLKVDGILCDPATIKNGRYPLRRGYLLCYKGSLSELESDFITYTRTAGQSIAQELCTSVRDAARFLSNGEAGTMTVNGSSSMEALIKAMVEDYVRYNPNAEIVIEVTDSTEGINSVLRGKADLALSSRSLASYEAELLEKYEIASDCIAVIVNKENPLSDISMRRLKSIYDGSVRSWGDLR